MFVRVVLLNTILIILSKSHISAFGNSVSINDESQTMEIEAHENTKIVEPPSNSKRNEVNKPFDDKLDILVQPDDMESIKFFSTSTTNANGENPNTPKISKRIHQKLRNSTKEETEMIPKPLFDNLVRPQQNIINSQNKDKKLSKNYPDISGNDNDTTYSSNVDQMVKHFGSKMGMPQPKVQRLFGPNTTQVNSPSFPTSLKLMDSPTSLQKKNLISHVNNILKKRGLRVKGELIFDPRLKKSKKLKNDDFTLNEDPQHDYAGESITGDVDGIPTKSQRRHIKKKKKQLKKMLNILKPFRTTPPTRADLMKYASKDPVVWRSIRSVCRIYTKFRHAEKKMMKNSQQISKFVGSSSSNAQKVLLETRDRLLKYKYHRKIFHYWCGDLKLKYHYIAKQLEFIQQFLSTLDDVRVYNSGKRGSSTFT